VGINRAVESEPPEQYSGRGLGRKVDRRRLLLRGALAAGGVAALVLPARRLLAPAEVAKPVTVGGLAVTCNLTLPIAAAANEAANPFGTRDAGQLAFGYTRYSGWPELKESLMSGDLQAAYMLAPLVMDLADKGVPVKIVSIGHRSGLDIPPRRNLRSFARRAIAVS
jgi:NitT/TauT family transport system substrate-binding protein